MTTPTTPSADAAREQAINPDDAHLRLRRLVCFSDATLQKEIYPDIRAVLKDREDLITAMQPIQLLNERCSTLEREVAALVRERDDVKECYKRETTAHSGVIARMKEALAFIGENAGHTVETEIGSLKCNSAWATEQCNAALSLAPETYADELATVKLRFAAFQGGQADLRKELAKACTQLQGMTDQFFAAQQELAKAQADNERLENLTASGIHTCSDTCQRPLCVLRRELAKERAEVERMTDAVELAVGKWLARYAGESHSLVAVGNAIHDEFGAVRTLELELAAAQEDRAIVDWIEKNNWGPSKNRHGTWTQVAGGGPMLRVVTGNTARSAIRAAMTGEGRETK